jgi:hypothetical protein
LFCHSYSANNGEGKKENIGISDRVFFDNGKMRAAEAGIKVFGFWFLVLAVKAHLHV